MKAAHQDAAPGVGRRSEQGRSTLSTLASNFGGDANLRFIIVVCLPAVPKSQSLQSGLTGETQSLKEFARQQFPALFNVLKSASLFRENLDVKRALGILARVNQASQADLQNAAIVERLIQRAGLHQSNGVGAEQEWPQGLERFANRGLKVWQSPAQFSKYLCFLSRYKITSYLEIGVAYGGTFVFTVAYLDRFNRGLKATCIDVRDPSQLVTCFSGIRPFQYITDKSCELFKHVDPNTSFDLVLVDGDHSRQGAMNDFHLVRNRAKIIAFHDIVNHKTPGAVEAWREVKENYGDGFEFYEFIDQYDELMQANQGKSVFGLGVAVSKNITLG
ncbi:MAG: class I SAM-dependent methyltransferase [Cyanobacteriota bacterium]